MNQPPPEGVVVAERATGLDQRGEDYGGESLSSNRGRVHSCLHSHVLFLSLPYLPKDQDCFLSTGIIAGPQLIRTLPIVSC